MDTLILKENSFICSYKGGLTTFLYEEVLSIESDKPFVKFKLKNHIVLSKTSLSTVEEKLPACFIRINRQVVVNMKHVNKIVLENGTYRIQLNGDIEYKISERKIKAVKTAYIEFN